MLGLGLVGRRNSLLACRAYQIPGLDFDFAGQRYFVNGQQKSLLDAMTFSRTSGGGRITSQGKFEWVAAGVPRIDYDPVTLACKGLLVEESRQNLFTYSADFTTAAWSKVRGTIVTAAAESPDGTVSASKIIDDATDSDHYFERVITPVAGTQYTAALFLKRSELTKSKVTLSGGGLGSDQGVQVSLVDGAVEQSFGSPGAEVLNVGNGWFRVCITATAATTAPMTFRCSLLNSGGNIVYAGAGTGLLIWGAQFEAGGFATSYIPTSSVTVIRAADIASFIGAQFSSWFNPVEGCVIFSGDMLSALEPGPRLFCFDDGTAGQNIRLGGGSFQVINGGVTQCNLVVTTPVNRTRYKVAANFKGDSFAASGNGASALLDNAGSIPTVDRLLLLGSSAAGITCGHVERIRYFRKQLPGGQLQSYSA